VENLTEKILSRCEDLELGFPGLVPQQVRDLPDSDVQYLIGLDCDSSTTPGNTGSPMKEFRTPMNLSFETTPHVMNQ
jgi:hypothetical protein